jgi:ribosomal-protein-alanine N-acetyltransferase
MTISSFNYLHQKDMASLEPEILLRIKMMDQIYIPHFWTEGAWSNLSEYEVTLCKEKSNQVIGFALFLINEHSDTAHLLKIVVDLKFRQQNIATSLILHARKYLPDIIKSIYLEVEMTNEPAIRFYQKIGFKEIHRIKNFYSNGSTAIIFSYLLD